MEEMINKFKAYPPEEQQKIMDKYRDAIATIYKNIDAEDLKLMLYCLEYLVKYINENHKDDPKNIKAWCAVVLMRRLKNKSINTEDDINDLIIKTFDHFKKEEYSIYLQDIAMFSNEYIRDVEYLNKLML